MNPVTLTYLKKYNKYYKESDIIYHNYAKKFELSDMALWILYSIAENDMPFTQRDFCRDWFFSPQTVNSALKDLEKKNIIYLEAVPGNKKNKLIKLTDYGKIFSANTIIPLIEAECASFEVLSKDECELMLSTTRRYISALKENIDGLEEIVPPN